MAAAGRIGDRAKCDADAHGCPACSHPVVGPGISGSPDVNVNGRPALRVGDDGVHSACCGPNMWKAAKGAATVFINGKAAHRKDDMTQHCGGVGKLIEGSPDVDIGDQTWKGEQPRKSFDQRFVVYEASLGVPLADRRYRITKPDGEILSGRTDAKGRTALVAWDSAARLKIEVLEDDETDGEDW